MAWAGSGFNEPWNEVTHRNSLENAVHEEKQSGLVFRLGEVSNHRHL